MRKAILSLLLILATVAAQAQWSESLAAKEGLPGSKKTYLGKEYYHYLSPLMDPGTSTNKIRITVTDNYGHQQPNGNNYVMALSELKVLDKNGNYIGYTAKSNADHNSLSYSIDGDGLPALNDNQIETYFHTMWLTPAVSAPHYVELTLNTSVSEFKLEWNTRVGDPYTVPTAVNITLGTDYIPDTTGQEFELGNKVTSLTTLTQSNKMFVMCSNSQDMYTSNGITYYASGPIFMRSAEEGDITASINHLVQFIPAGNGKYILYWPVTGKFLQNSTSEYNGSNGWQYSTADFSEAALINFSKLSNNDFEFSYSGEYIDKESGNVKEITVYVSGEVRDGVDSKMKIFTLDKKQALENGDYTSGYSLPAAFNWTIYEANVSDETIKEYALSTSLIASNLLSDLIMTSSQYLSTYGDFDGNCTNGENNSLVNAISDAIQLLEYESPSINDIYATKEQLLQCETRYIGVKLNIYENEIKSLIANSKFSSAPNEVGTYPEESRTTLNKVLTSIDKAQATIDSYNTSSLFSFYEQIDKQIDNFKKSIITKTEEGGSGSGSSGNETVILPPSSDDEECIYVYLVNSGVDAFALSTLSGEYYDEDGSLYIPLASGDTISYSQNEYTRYTTEKPEFPTLTSFKFNNKYNHNLFVDVIADTIKPTMNIALNSIGKWLVPSFNLSDDRAVAFVDTTYVQSKDTRINFADDVKFVVTYPGYYKLTNVKIQDEIWSTPGGDTMEEIPLTADALYTNKPSKQTGEGLENLLDNMPSTIFHSTWGSDNNATLYINCYITIDLPTELEEVTLYYKCRPQSGYNPLELQISVSNDYASWTPVRTLTTKDGMPTGGMGAEYTSPVINFGGKYKYLKIEQTSGENAKNHFAISELHLYKIIPGDEEPVKIQDAVYATRRMPFGNNYNINPDWLTDKATSVPRIDIDLKSGSISQIHYNKEVYQDATFRITGYGVYDDFEAEVQIKGRGNSTWSYPKKPYRLKFSEKVKPFGLTKGKSWVLLANYQTGSLLANAIAMEVGHLAGAQYTNHIVPVELYINGQYLGNYMFSEKVGMANNSVDVDEETGYMLELDVNYDETYKFYSNSYNLPVNVKEPDLTEYMGNPSTRFGEIKADFNEFESVLKSGASIDDYVDMDALARFILVNQFVINQELGHPKSTFLWKEDLSSPSSKIVFGPLWDFDWGFGYETSKSYCTSNVNSSIFNSSMSTSSGYRFFQAITKNESFKRHYYSAWKKFVDSNRLQQLCDYIEEYYNFAKGSFENNYYEWGDGKGYDKDVERAKNWLKERQDYIMANIDKYSDIGYISNVLGDVNCNNEFTIEDLTILIDYLNGILSDEYSSIKADINESGIVSDVDATEMAMLLLVSPTPSPMYYFNTPMVDARIGAEDICVSIGDHVDVPITLTGNKAEEIVALQMDIYIPNNVSLLDATAGDILENHNFEYNQMDDNSYRVVVHSMKNDKFLSGNSLIDLSLSIDEALAADEKGISISNILVTSEREEMRLNEFSIRPEIATAVLSMEDVVADIRGGNCLSITLLDAKSIRIYSLDGRVVRELELEAGTTTVELPAGIYIVENSKVIIR